MSWKFSTPYTTRDLSSSRDNTSQSKFGTSPISSSYNLERQSRWSTGTATAEPARTYRINTPQTDQNATRAKTTVAENPSSVVQRLKERYSSSNSLGGDNEKLSTSTTRRPYGRSLTTLSVGSTSLKPKQSSYEAESKREYGCRNGPLRKSPERDKTVSYDRFKRSDSIQSYDSKIYTPKSPEIYTSKFLPKTATNEKPHKEAKEPQNEIVNNHDDDSEGEVVTVIARGTSPSQTTTSLYLRTRRADFGIEKKIHRPKIKPPFSHKETQTDKQEESHVSRFGYTDINSRAKPWSSYMGGSSYGSRFSSRSSYKEKESPTTPTRTDYLGLRSLSRENSTLESKSPDLSPRSPCSSVESPQSPKSIADAFKQSEPHVTAKPPTSFRSTETIKLNIQKPPGLSNKDGDKVIPLRKAPSSTKPLKIETTSTPDDQAKSPTLNCVNAKKISAAGNVAVTNGNITDGSSMSESTSEDETSSSDEEVERIKASETSFVKKSITNFLQNIPNVGVRKQPSCAELVNRSRSGVFHKINQLAPPPKITFNRVESGERAWWMDNNEPVPDGVVKILSNCCLAKPEQPNDGQGNDKPVDGANTNGFGINTKSYATDSNTNLRLTYLINRQFTTDLDWLKDTEEEEECKPKDGKWDLDGNNNISNGHGVAILEEDEDEKNKTNCGGYTCINKQGAVPNGNECVNIDNVCNAWLREESNVAQNACANIDVCLPSTSNEVIHTLVQRNSSDESIDVTPGLRRRREQNRGKSPEICRQTDIPRFNQDSAESENFTEMKDRPQNMVQNNNVIEDKDVGDMSNLISKAKAGLVKSKTKLDVRKSSSREMSPKHEIDLYWKELVDSINRPLKLCDLDFTDLNTDDETDVFGNLRGDGAIPPPPPPPMMILPPNGLDLKVPLPPANVNPNKISKVPAPPPIIQNVKNKKTVKLFWKEVKDDAVLPVKPSGGSLIWDELVKVSVDTQKLEQLFESRAKDLITKKQHEQNKSKEIIVLDHKRSNAINIGMTKLPPPRAIKTAILKMDSTVINKEGIEKLLTMLPTEEEKLRIQDAQSSNPDLPLGSAEQFLLILASISELEARLKLWAFKLDFENSEKEICEPLMDLKQGIEILRSNKTFRAILSTLLSIGNFLNGCDVKGFQIDYLSKVPEVKDTVQKHSLLHHLCAIVMEKFPESTDLYSEIGAVTRASKVDFDELTGNIKKIEEECKLSWNYLKIIAKHEGHTAMKVKMSDFLADCAERIIVLGIVHKRVMSRFHKFIFWLGIPMNRISITRPNEIFKVISEFALEYRTTRERILQQIKKMNHREKSRSRGHLAGDTYDGLRKMNSKEAKDDAKLRQLLSGDSTYAENTHNNSTWRRHRKDTRNLIDVTNNNDDEIIETLIKTANQIPSHRPSMKDRRRSTKVYDRKC